MHVVSSCSEFVQVVRLFSFVFGSARLCEAALIQVVLVLSVVFICSGFFSTVFSCLKLRQIFMVFRLLGGVCSTRSL